MSVHMIMLTHPYSMQYTAIVSIKLLKKIMINCDICVLGRKYEKIMQFWGTLKYMGVFKHTLKLILKFLCFVKW